MKVAGHKPQLLDLLDAELDALRAELDTIRARWMRGLAMEREGWASEAKERQALATFAALASREAEIRGSLPPAIIATLPPPAWELHTTTEEAPHNPLIERLVALGGWVGLSQRYSEQMATAMHSALVAWGRAKTDRARSEAARRFEALEAELRAADSL
jgi:hypothetical protein